MSIESHRFKVGAFECMAVSDGTHTYGPPTFPIPATFLFSNASRERLEQTLREHGLQPERWTEWVSQYICLVVNTGEHMVLVDTGADGLSPGTGRLIQNLRREGFAPGDIDTVVLTHGHPDHIGGNTDSDGEPAFCNARFVMWKDEWDFWASDLTGLKAQEHVKELLLTFAHRNLPPIQGRLDLIGHEREVVPGIRAFEAPGHTPGHMALAVSSEGQHLLCVSDAVLHPIHVEQPDWYAAIDFDPLQVATTRRRIFHSAAVQNALVLAFHFPFPGLGHIVQGVEGWRWQSI